MLDKFNNEKDRILIKENNNKFSIIKKEWLDESEIQKDKNGELYTILNKFSPMKSFIDFVGSAKGTRDLNLIFDKKVFDNPKPEALIQRILEISTQPNDIVMDFFLGSGTTAAVAHKMNRQYIGIEQMDYIESVSVERLKKVIEGEQGGVSKSLKWQGGGEFIYLELAKLNQNFIDKLSKADDKTILEIYDEICDKGFLNYDADAKVLQKEKGEFKNLNLDEKKEFLIHILNKNMLYVNLDDIEDENYEISNDDKKLNEEFYNE